PPSVIVVELEHAINVISISIYLVILGGGGNTKAHFSNILEEQHTANLSAQTHIQELLQERRQKNKDHMKELRRGTQSGKAKKCQEL
ncbi:hypothetical protein ACJX0J_022450, partial [Zea mays]